MHRVLPPANVLLNLAKSVQAASRQPRSLKVKRSIFFSGSAAARSISIFIRSRRGAPKDHINLHQEVDVSAYEPFPKPFPRLYVYQHSI